MPEALSKEVILDALGRLNDALKNRDVRGELCLFGGAVMVLAFQARPSTQDVDAIFRPTAEFLTERAFSCSRTLQVKDAHSVACRGAKCPSSPSDIRQSATWGRNCFLQTSARYGAGVQEAGLRP